MGKTVAATGDFKRDSKGYEVLRDGLPVWGWSSGPLGVARGTKGRGPGLTFDLKRALSNFKMEPEKA